MKFAEIIAVTGLPGLYTVVKERKGGVIVEEMESGKRRFAPARKHQFAPLESMAVYTDDGDAEPLRKVFDRMLEQQEDNPAPAANETSERLFDYFEDVLPTYDKERVHSSDVKRLLKWYHYLLANQLFEKLGEEEE
ncbi:hypothetical protein CLV84_2084 [Neolewinella xylanilytica]|uniref:DUF5606 domain-containing protein n=1 Tax=Neolewinella xylanilytica TaxID=1514080 RepID=A0A2S6I1Y9_9BACT|nr:DUF5606 domain-containing protein [Neolewinella xylanilytica]PPK85192.1 hypothetical protein CLV84_2084 [Neolewinella xylanilytica]